jgi:hypothetical protein
MSIGAVPGLIDASIHGRCAGEGFGVHTCTGLVFGDDAELGECARDPDPRSKRLPAR